MLEESIGNLPPLPQIVVIGDECAGKSSLLESITKCSVFPRDERVCTRMPIRLRLTQVGRAKCNGLTTVCSLTRLVNST